jgi:hypothetical protein
VPVGFTGAPGPRRCPLLTVAGLVSWATKPRVWNDGSWSPSPATSARSLFERLSKCTIASYVTLSLIPDARSVYWPWVLKKATCRGRGAVPQRGGACRGIVSRGLEGAWQGCNHTGAKQSVGGIDGARRARCVHVGTDRPRRRTVPLTAKELILRNSIMVVGSVAAVGMLTASLHACRAQRGRGFSPGLCVVGAWGSRRVWVRGQQQEGRGTTVGIAHSSRGMARSRWRIGRPLNPELPTPT